MDENCSKVFVAHQGKVTNLNGSTYRNSGQYSRNCATEMRLKKFFTYSVLCNFVYYCSFFETCFYRSTGIMAGMSSLLVVFCCYWSIGVMAGRPFLL